MLHGLGSMGRAPIDQRSILIRKRVQEPSALKLVVDLSMKKKLSVAVSLKLRLNYWIEFVY